MTVKALVNGKLEDRSRTLYETIHGPMFTSLLGLPLFPWTPATALRPRRREREQLPLPQPLRGDRPGPVGARVPRDPGALPGHPVGELARRRPQRRGLLLDERGDPEPAEREGEPVPDHARSPVTGPACSACRSPTASRSACMWGGKEAGAADEGLLPNSRIPFRFRRDYVHNGNDSHWLANPSAPLEGFDRIVGIERAEVTPAHPARAGDDARPPGGPRRAARQALQHVDPRAPGPGQPPVPGRAVARPHRGDLPGEPDHQRRGRERRLRRARALEHARRPRRPGRAAVPPLRLARLPRHAVAAHRHPGLGRAGRAGLLRAFDANRPVDTPTGLQDSNKVRSALAERGHRPAGRRTPAQHVAAEGSRRTAPRARRSTAGPAGWACSRRSAPPGTARASARWCTGRASSWPRASRAAPARRGRAPS